MNYTRFVSLTLLFFVLPPAVHAQRPMEYLDRSLVAMQTQKGVYLTWRMLGTDDPEIGFNLYRNGSDELIYGACAFDHDGTPLYSTGFGHGDSHALGDFDPDHPGLEFFQGHEGGKHGITFREAGTGKVLWEILDSGDVGRAWAGDVDPKYRGAECTMIGRPHKNYDCKGNAIPTNYNPYSQPVYFDGRPYQAVRGGNIVEGEGGRIFTGWHYSAGTVHGSKNDTNLTADIIGDWREEIIMLRSDKKAFVMFSSWIPTERKNYTLMHDPTYRMNIAVQNVGYNQPAHPGFFFADGMPKPEIKLVRYEKP